MKKTWMLMVFLCISLMTWGQDRKTIMAKAQAGDPEMQVRLGHAYLSGWWGLAKNEEEAVKWYQKAAEQGYAKGQVRLGHAYLYGWGGITTNEEEAVKWYRKAAEQGYAEGQYNLGNCFYSGYGVTKDEEEAMKWYHKAAEQGYGNSYYDLGLIYQYREENRSEAIKWYKKYADYWYKESGDENSTTIESLKELGVAYNPRTKETTYLNSNASSGSSSSSGNTHISSSSGSSSSNNKDLLYKGMYTISGQGYSQVYQKYNDFPTPDETVEVEIYEDGISIGGLWCKYERNSGNMRRYAGLSSSFGGSTSEVYFYVNPTTFEMRKESVFSSAFGSDTYVHAISKGECTMPRYNNGGSTSGSYSTGSGTQSHTGTSSSGSSTSNKRACTICKFTTCKGSGQVLSTSYGTRSYIRCKDCSGTGRCRYCNGTGYR